MHARIYLIQTCFFQGRAGITNYIPLWDVTTHLSPNLEVVVGNKFHWKIPCYLLFAYHGCFKFTILHFANTNVNCTALSIFTLLPYIHCIYICYFVHINCGSTRHDNSVIWSALILAVGLLKWFGVWTWKQWVEAAPKERLVVGSGYIINVGLLWPTFAAVASNTKNDNKWSSFFKIASY